MLNLTSLNLLVTDLEQSREFFTKVLGEAPIEGSPHCACWKLPSGVEFGLVQAGIPARAELVFETDEPDVYPEVLSSLGANVLAPPTDRRFGRTAVLAELNEHRVRLVRAAQRQTSVTKAVPLAVERTVPLFQLVEAPDALAEPVPEPDSLAAKAYAA